jgi:ribose transport system permease protein
MTKRNYYGELSVNQATTVTAEKIKSRSLSQMNLKGMGLIGILILIVIMMSILSPYFLSGRNFINILLSITIIAIGAVGATLVIIGGGLDLSVQSIIACTSVFIAVLNRMNIPIELAIFCGLTAGPLFGLINGFVITKLKVNSVITTLATMQIIRGIALLGANSRIIPLKTDVTKYLSRGRVFGIIPISVIIMIIVFIIFYLILKRTTFGRSIYAIGGNPEAARLAGINVDRVTIYIYVIAGTLASISGVLFASITGAGLPNGAAGYSLQIIAAVILGGTALSGGIGTIQGTLIGVLIVGVMNNGLALLNIPTFWQKIIMGSVLILAVLFERISINKTSQ